MTTCEWAPVTSEHVTTASLFKLVGVPVTLYVLLMVTSLSLLYHPVMIMCPEIITKPVELVTDTYNNSIAH